MEERFGGPNIAWFRISTRRRIQISYRQKRDLHWHCLMSWDSVKNLLVHAGPLKASLGTASTCPKFCTWPIEASRDPCLMWMGRFWATCWSKKFLNLLSVTAIFKHIFELLWALPNVFHTLGCQSVTSCRISGYHTPISRGYLGLSYEPNCLIISGLVRLKNLKSTL